MAFFALFLLTLTLQSALNGSYPIFEIVDSGIAPNVRYAELYVEAARQARAKGLGPYPALAQAFPDCPTEGIYVSEYVEGSGNNKALEIYNETADTLELSCLRVEMYFNGATEPEFQADLSGELPSGEVFVLWHESAGPELTAIASALPYNRRSGFGWFNGDDVVLLKSGGVVADSFGTVGVRPDGVWSREVRTKDRTLRRKPEVTTGDADPTNAFDPSSEWLEFPKNTFDGLGHR